MLIQTTRPQHDRERMQCPAPGPSRLSGGRGNSQGRGQVGEVRFGGFRTGPAGISPPGMEVEALRPRECKG